MIDIIKNNRNNLVADAPAKWRTASVAIYDALNEDILVALKNKKIEERPVVDSVRRLFEKAF